MSVDIAQYTGKNIPNVLQSENARQCYRWCMEYMHDNYGDNVEYEEMLYHVLLCDETRDYLYNTKPAPVKYRRGMRPVLDEIVDKVIEGCVTEREKVLAIFRYVRDLHNEWEGADVFFGGTEEELIKKREWFCERVARLLVGLCEVAGFPGRIVFHIAAGHLTSEIYFEGKWGYIDPRCGLYYLWEDGRFMSVDEIVRNRDRIYKQKPEVYGERCTYWSEAYRKHRNYHFCLSPLEMQCLCAYSLTDTDRYHFDWMIHDEAARRADPAHQKYVEYGMMTLIPHEEA